MSARRPGRSKQALDPSGLGMRTRRSGLGRPGWARHSASTTGSHPTPGVSCRGPWRFPGRDSHPLARPSLAGPSTTRPVCSTTSPTSARRLFSGRCVRTIAPDSSPPVTPSFGWSASSSASGPRRRVGSCPHRQGRAPRRGRPPGRPAEATPRDPPFTPRGEGIPGAGEGEAGPVAAPARRLGRAVLAERSPAGGRCIGLRTAASCARGRYCPAAFAGSTV